MKIKRVGLILLVVAAILSFWSCPDKETETRFTVSFNINKGTGTVPASQTVTPGTSITLPDGSNFSKDEHSFIGWSTEVDSTEADYKAGDQYTVNENITMYAIWIPAGIPCTISFDINGGTGTIPADQSVNAGANITFNNGAGFSKTGWEFTGWNTSNDGTGTHYDAGSSYTVNENLTLFARWSRTVTFNGNTNTDGAVPTALSVHVNGIESITLPENGNLVKTGWTFAGWNTDTNGTTGTLIAPGDSYTPTTAETTLYARWFATVSFDRNGATGTTPSQTVYAGGNANITLPATLSRDGFTFYSWNANAAGTGTNYNASASYTISGNITLYAIWTATVTFNSNGGSGITPTALTGNDGGSITLPAAPDLSMTGHVFAGWSISQTSGDILIANALYDIPSSGNITLYARWIETSSQVTVTFNLNGATSGSTPGSISKYPGESITLPSATGIGRTGFAFAGWNTSADGTGADYAASSTYNVTQNRTLYAKWTAQITFNLNNGSGTTPALRTENAGAVITLPNDTGFSRTNYTFAGWSTNQTGGTILSAGSNYTVNGNATLYARWTGTVSFNLNGGSGTTPNNLTPAIGSNTVTLPAYTGTRSGWSFTGWNTQANGLGDNYAANATYTVDQNIPLYARWSRTLNFAANGGTGSVASIQAHANGTNNTNPSVILPAGTGFSRTGYTFAGWSTATTGGTILATGASHALTAATNTINARWTGTVSFNLNGGNGTIPTALTPALGSSTVTLPTYNGTRTGGWTFTGWNTDANGSMGTRTAAGTTYTVTGDITLYARWTRTLNFAANGGTGTVASMEAHANGTNNTNPTVTLPDGTGFSRTGYTFDGWNTNANGSGTNTAAGASYSPASASTTLYARWAKTVIFNGNGSTGGTAPAEQKIYANGTSTTVPSFNLPAAGTLVRTNYTFAGWSTVTTGGTVLAAGSSYTPPANASTTLYARWTEAATPVTGTWKNLNIPSATTARQFSQFQGRSEVLHIAPVNNNYEWAVLEHSLAAYAGKEITISISVDAWVDIPTKVVWQANLSTDPRTYPTIAGSTNTNISAGQWVAVTGENTITVPSGGGTLYLSKDQLVGNPASVGTPAGNVELYIANFVLTITETPTSNLPTSFAGFTVPSETTATRHSSFQSRSDVLQVTGTEWAILEYSLAAYVGKEINIELSYDVRVSAAAAVAWQINFNPGYPVAAGSTNTTLAANQWHAVTGSARVTPTATNGNTLYLNRGDLNTVSAYFANFVLKITEVEAPPPITGGAIVLDYDVQWTVTEGDVAYICVYGWSRNPQASGAATLVEYYIIESLGSYNPGTYNNGQSSGSATIDGKIYDFYVKTRTNQPSIEGNRTFLQYFSIRRGSTYTRGQQQTLEGTIDVSAHFLAWQAADMLMGNDLYEVTLCVEAYANANAVTRGTANIRKNELRLQGQSIAGTGGSLPNPHPIVNNLINNSGARYRGYDYEFWTDAASGSNTGSMTLNNNTAGAFNVSWDNRGNNSDAYNILFRMGRRGGF